MEERFIAHEFEKHIPHCMRFKHAEIITDSVVYWVTQEGFTEKDLTVFRKAVKENGKNVQKFFVVPRDFSGYGFEEDMVRGVLVEVTADYIKKIKKK